MYISFCFLPTKDARGHEVGIFLKVSQSVPFCSIWGLHSCPGPLPQSEGSACYGRGGHKGLRHQGQGWSRRHPLFPSMYSYDGGGLRRVARGKCQSSGKGGNDGGGPPPLLSVLRKSPQRRTGSTRARFTSAPEQAPSSNQDAIAPGRVLFNTPKSTIVV